MSTYSYKKKVIVNLFLDTTVDSIRETVKKMIIIDRVIDRLVLNGT